MFDENLIKIEKYELLGKLPDPFLFKDGTRLSSSEDWRRRREEMYDDVISLQYGALPPEPEFLEVEPLHYSYYKGISSYRVTTGRRDYPVSFIMYISMPYEHGKYPAVIDGDLCFRYPFDKDFLAAFSESDIYYVFFNRTELVPDIDTGNRNAPLYECYPDYDFGAIGAWAWGYSRCVDALEKLGFADMEHIAFTGHSRGGKTAAVAGAVDERAFLVNPNATCAGAFGCYRIHCDILTESGEVKRSETLADLNERFPFWMGKRLHAYNDREEELPFDCHFLKAMVAPRILFVSEAASDAWGNPVGSWQTTEAAKEVYKFLGKEENLLWYFRKGNHAHEIEDVEQLVNVINHFVRGEKLNGKFFRTPFVKPEKAFDWSCP